MISWISLINFIIRRTFFSHLSYLFVATLSRPSSSSVSEFSQFFWRNFHFCRHFLFAEKGYRRSNHSSQPHDAYYLLQNIKMENSNSNGGQMKPSIKSADMKEVRHRKTTTNKSSSRARHLVVAKFSKVKPTDAFAKKNESSLLMNN